MKWTVRRSSLRRDKRTGFPKKSCVILGTLLLAAASCGSQPTSLPATTITDAPPTTTSTTATTTPPSTQAPRSEPPVEGEVIAAPDFGACVRAEGHQPVETNVACEPIDFWFMADQTLIVDTKTMGADSAIIFEHQVNGLVSSIKLTSQNGARASGVENLGDLIDVDDGYVTLNIDLCSWQFDEFHRPGRKVQPSYTSGRLLLVHEEELVISTSTNGIETQTIEPIVYFTIESAPLPSQLEAGWVTRATPELYDYLHDNAEECLPEASPNLLEAEARDNLGRP